MATVFFSYSHKDEALRDQLETHLAMLKRQGLIESWHDRRIVAGSEIDQSIADAMESSEVILLLVSADFLESSYCYSREMMRAMTRHRAGEARVIPVILRDCDWHAAPFGELLAAPKDGKAITLWPDIDQAFSDVAKQVRRAVEELNGVPAGAQAVVSPSTVIHSQSSILPGAQLPRSSNLRLKKDFSELDKDEYLRSGFDFIARFFEGSIQAIEKRNPGVKGAFERIDLRRFSAVLYRGGSAVSQCSIRLEGMTGRSSNIAFSYDASARAGSYNEMLHVEADSQMMFFKAMGMQTGGGRDTKLSPEGAAEFLWDLLISRLQ
jgi:hypothetical protein